MNKDQLKCADYADRVVFFGSVIIAIFLFGVL